MKNLWSDKKAKAFIKASAKEGVSADLAECVHASRLLGANPKLVLHGGGNSSVKTVLADLTGENVTAMWVKGSGRDMADIGAGDFAPVRLEPLRRLAERDSLSEGEMADARRCFLLDAAAPDPSVEFLTHAFLPHKHVLHSHSNAVLALTNQSLWAEVLAETFAGRVALVPYIMSGFSLARRARDIQAANPDAEGLVVLKHGLFTFAGTAGEAYRRMIDLVTLAEKRIEKAGRKAFAPAAVPKKIAAAAEVAPVLRGLAAPDGGRTVLDFRSGREIRAFVDGFELADYGLRGTPTPDYVIRTKPWPMIAPAPEAGKLEAFAKAAAEAVDGFKADYMAYVERNAGGQADIGAGDPLPRVILVPGLGLFGLGRTAGDAAIAADLAAAGIEVIANAEGLGRYESAGEADIFAIENWPPERAKLDRAGGRLAGRVAVVTGGGGAIGAATAGAFAAEGAEVAVFDIDAEAARAIAAEIGPHALALPCDVTDPDSVGAAFDRVCEAFGGLDIVVSNAGAAWQGPIGEVGDAILRRSFELNFFAHQTVAQNAVSVMRAQGLGGALLFNTSKQAVNPGAGFGPYGIPKAATLFLVRQYALEYGADGIRTGGVNADRIRSGLLSDRMIASRARARQVSEAEYMAGNLLGREVTADDVAAAFVYLAMAEASTGDILTVDGGNIAAALR